MFIIVLSYKASLEELSKHQDAHRAWLKRGLTDGWLVAAGPQSSRTGGIILALASDLAEMNAIVESDPFIMERVACADIIEFTPTITSDALQALIKA